MPWNLINRQPVKKISLLVSNLAKKSSSLFPPHLGSQPIRPTLHRQKKMPCVFSGLKDIGKGKAELLSQKNQDPLLSHSAGPCRADAVMFQKHGGHHCYWVRPDPGLSPLWLMPACSAGPCCHSGGRVTVSHSFLQIYSLRTYHVLGIEMGTRLSGDQNWQVSCPLEFRVQRKIQTKPTISHVNVEGQLVIRDKG